MHQPSSEESRPYYVSTRLAAALMGHQPPYEVKKPIELLHEHYLHFTGRTDGVPTVARSEQKSLELFKQFHPMAIEFFSHGSRRSGGQVWRNDQPIDRFFRSSAEVGQRDFKLPVNSSNPQHPGYVLLANYTLPLIDTQVTMPDPINPESSGVTADSYTQAWAAEARFIRARSDDNAIRKMKNLEPLPMPERNYRALPPFSGAMKVHIARDEQHLDEMDNHPIPDYWVSQLHFVNAVQRKVLENFGLPSEYKNRLRIGLFSPKGDRGHLYCIPYDQVLEAELFRRLEVFLQCVYDGVSPSAPKVRKNFDYYRVESIQKNLQILPQNIEQMALKAMQEMTGISKEQAHLDDRRAGFQKVLDRIYTDYTQNKGDVVLLPGGRTLQQAEPDDAVNISLIAEALQRAVRLQESVERLYQLIQRHDGQNSGHGIDALMVSDQLEDMLSMHAIDRSLLESVIDRDLAQMRDNADRPIAQVARSSDARLYEQLAARRDQAVPAPMV